MAKKIRVAVLFGGRSAEHEVSLQSAKNVISAIDKEKYEVVLIGIDHDGKWYLNESSHFLLNEENPKLIRLATGNRHLALVPGDDSQQIMSTTREGVVGTIDVVFPILHGPFGEDGTVQGLLKLADLPFVGEDVLVESGVLVNVAVLVIVGVDVLVIVFVPVIVGVFETVRVGVNVGGGGSGFRLPKMLNPKFPGGTQECISQTIIKFSRFIIAISQSKIVPPPPV